MITVKFKQWICKLEYHAYSNKRVAIQLIDIDPKQPGVVAVATVNVPEKNLADDEVIIKDYSENMGMVAALEEAGIVKDTGKIIPLGFVYGNICKLLIDKKAYNGTDNNR